MAGYQQVTIVGNVGRDPSFKYTPQGTAVCDFSVAVTRRFSTGDQRQEKTTWFKVTCWNKLAEIANQYVSKGTPVLVAGTIDVTAYTDKNDQPQASLEIRADQLQLLGGRDESERGHHESTDDVPF